MLTCVSREVKKLISIPKIINCFHYEHFVCAEKHKDDYKTGIDIHDFWEIVYVEKGSVITYYDGDIIRLREKEIFFCAPNKPHKTVSENVEYTLCHFITFESKSKIMTIFENRVIELDEHLLNIIDSMIDMSKKTFTYLNTKTERVYLKLLNDAPVGGLQMYKLYLEMFIIELVWHTNKTDALFTYNTKSEFEKKLFNEMKKIMAEKIYSDFTIQILCECINYSKSHISAIFKKYSGTTILNYYANLKINEAKKLLKKNEFSISEISEMLCYSSPYYFSYAFKKETGTSPSEYIKKHSK